MSTRTFQSKILFNCNDNIGSQLFKYSLVSRLYAVGTTSTEVVNELNK